MKNRNFNRAEQLQKERAATYLIAFIVTLFIAISLIITMTW